MIVRELINLVKFKTDPKGPKKVDGILGKITGKLKGMGGIFGKVGGKLEQFIGKFGALKALGIVGLLTAVGVAILGIGRKAIQVAADMESMTVQFEVMLGSAELAEDMMVRLQEFSAATPFQLPQLVKGTQNLIAFGVAAEDSLGVMRMLGDASGGNAEKLATLVRAYGKTQAKGKATLEELNMITESGVPIIKMLADQAGLTTEQFLNMKGGVKVTSAAITQAFKTMTSEGGIFFEGMKKQSETMLGLQSTLADNIDLSFGALGNKLLPAMKSVFRDLIKVVQEFLKPLMEIIGIIVGPLVGGIIALFKPVFLILIGIGKILQLWLKIFKFLGNVIKKTFEIFSKAIIGIFKWLLRLLLPIDKLKEGFKSLGMFIKDTLSTVMKFFEDSINFIIKGINFLISSINKLPIGEKIKLIEEVNLKGATKPGGNNVNINNRIDITGTGDNKADLNSAVNAIFNIQIQKILTDAGIS